MTVRLHSNSRRTEGTFPTPEAPLRPRPLYLFKDSCALTHRLQKLRRAGSAATIANFGLVAFFCTMSSSLLLI